MTLKTYWSGWQTNQSFWSQKKGRTKQLKHPLSEVTLMHYARCLVHLLIIMSQNIHHCMQDWILTDNCRWVAWIVAGDGSEFKLFAILCLSWFYCQVMSAGLSNILEDGGSNVIPSACQFYTGQLSQDKPTPMFFPWTFVERIGKVILFKTKVQRCLHFKVKRAVLPMPLATC